MGSKEQMDILVSAIGDECVGFISDHPGRSWVDLCDETIGFSADRTGEGATSGVALKVWFQDEKGIVVCQMSEELGYAGVKSAPLVVRAMMKHAARVARKRIAMWQSALTLFDSIKFDGSDGDDQ
jgi:hypothetical protein